MNDVPDRRHHVAPSVTVREVREDDWPQIWPIIHDVITEQQTFSYDPTMSELDARRMWLLGTPARAVVAAHGDRVVGTANMYANRPGPGSHIASGSLMVAREARGAGAGRALTVDMITWARRSGFAAIQFNAVVDVNTAAVRLYESLGFVTLGTAPGAFRHPTLGDVGLRIMWLDLRRPGPSGSLPLPTRRSCP
ncbi:GNAT family N-acetyltransferase [Amycolatopsis balhimycina]|uniref:GNAT family N-acetyltransferase n=1 Tax=Amycolatopsis balhimycina TaxID=208443 RepID=UPI00037D60F8|nr:GNAT family N-acetyltransferase [Amycolatopsis balhimycina]